MTLQELFTVQRKITHNVILTKTRTFVVWKWESTMQILCSLWLTKQFAYLSDLFVPNWMNYLKYNHLQYCGLVNLILHPTWYALSDVVIVAWFIWIYIPLNQHYGISPIHTKCQGSSVFDFAGDGARIIDIFSSCQLTYLI